ncbi:MAG TPA: hypothetical protein VMW77_09215 [Methanoregula sp.]|nr:hypothetical protein [Methanoregula sp.]
MGFNGGAAAGQNVMHCHCHFIPRYGGDTDNFHQGIRGIILRKGNPWKPGHPLRYC